MQKGQGLIFIIVGILVTALIAGGAYYLGRSTSPKPSANPVVTSTATPFSTPLSTETLVKMDDETTHWKTYTNTQLGFEMKYPPEKIVEVEENITNYEPGQNTDSSISFIFSKEDCSAHFCQGMHFLVPKIPQNIKTLREALEQGYCGTGCIELNEREDKLTIGGVEALGQGNPFSDDSQTYDVHFLKDNYLYNVTLFSRNINISKYRPLFDQMLSTFKFL